MSRPKALDAVVDLEAQPLSRAIGKVFESGIRSEAAMIFLYSSAQHLETDLATAKADLRKAESDAEYWRAAYQSQAQTLAVLQERNRMNSNLASLQNFFMSIGGVVLGVAAPLLGSAPGWSAAGSVLGAIFLLGGLKLKSRADQDRSAAVAAHLASSQPPQPPALEMKLTAK